MMRQLSVFIFISILLAACAPTINRVGPSSTTTQPACQPSQILKSSNSFPEIQGTMKSAGELWALLFFDTAHVNEELKFVWRITFTGTDQGFHAEARNENRTTILPVWGPDFHTSSSWQRPGKEWGTGFNFPTPGCWTITVTSGATKGEIYLDVLPP